jgi:hypothetical protein
MVIVVREGKRTRPTPTLVPPPIPAFLPPPDPPKGGKGGGVVYILSYYMQLTQPHMLRVPPFLENLG